MVLELLFSCILIVFFAYCAINAMVTFPDGAANELSAKQWSVGILVLLLLFLVLNVINVYKKIPKEQRNLSCITSLKITDIVKSRLFLGIVAMIAYVALVNTLGFLLTSFIFCTVFCMLLGEKKVPRAVVFSLFVTIILFVIFFKGMGVILPRGTGVMRTMSQAVEKFLRNLF